MVTVAIALRHFVNRNRENTFCCFPDSGQQQLFMLFRRESVNPVAFLKKRITEKMRSKKNGEQDDLFSVFVYYGMISSLLKH